MSRATPSGFAMANGAEQDDTGNRTSKPCSPNSGTSLARRSATKKSSASFGSIFVCGIFPLGLFHPVSK